MTRPLTVTRPCVTHSSASRREASPARATTLAMRSPLFFFGSAARRPLVEVGLAFAIGAAAAERRTLGKNLAVVLVLAARPVFTGFVARMFLPVGAAFRPLTRTVEFRAVAAVFTGPVEFRPFTERTIAGTGRSSRFMPTACESPPSEPKSLARTAIPRICHGCDPDRRPDQDGCQNPSAGRDPARRAMRTFVAAKFPLHAAIAIARRPRAEGTIATGPVAVFAETFAARRIRPLLAVAIARRIGLLVAEFLVLETPGRTRVVRGRGPGAADGRRG